VHPKVAATAAAALLLSVAVVRAESSDETGAVLEPVQVTGSRLRALAPGSDSPLTVVTRDELEASGLVRLGDILQRLPFAGGSPLNTRTSQRGSGGGLSRGIETIELRGLGAERTLVLVNGRRFVPGGNGASGAVDLGMLPLALVDRIEIFKSGASVEYGADAVAGVINVITRDSVDGVELSARAGVSSRGDGETFALQAVTGRRAARGGFVAGLDYSDQSPVSRGERDFSFARLSFAGPDNTPVFDGSSAPPGGQFRTSLGRLTRIDGRSGSAIEDFRPFGDEDRFNFNPFEDLLQASERLSLFANADWQAAASVRLGVETMWHRRDSSQRLVALPFFSNRLSDVRVAAGNVFNPFGEDLADVRRRLIEAGPRRFSQDNEAWRVVLFADGRRGSWFWDASINRGRNETDQRQTGDLLADRVRQALGPSFLDTQGRAVCGTPDAPLPGCVPLNLFGPVGSITDAMLDYVAVDLDDRGFNEQTVFAANLAGDLLSLPAGPLALATGLEWREERGADRPDAESRAGNTTGNARAATAGSFQAREAYLELGVPLLAGRRWAERLDLEFGGRLIDFDNFGSESLFDLRLGWQPHPALSLGVNWSEAFRAPGIGELFGGLAQSNPIVLDPCADFGTLDPLSIERCIAQGVPADGSFSQNGEETPELGGGNPALQPERAEILNFGMGWLPWGASGPRLRLDYYDIEIRDGIGALGANTVLQQCLATGAAAFCDAIQRDSDGRIEFVEAGLRNIARERARGLDLEAGWSQQVGPGRLRHRALLSHVIERRVVAFPGAEPLFGEGEFDPDRFGAVPEWRGSYDLEWSGPRWSLGYRASWIDSYSERGGEVFPGTRNRVGAVLYHDLRAGWRVSERLRLDLGVDNVGDVQPPLLVNADEANTDLSTYRALGRGFWLRLSARL
jgi:outer membrane receptor protein involved in Fe transport